MLRKYKFYFSISFVFLLISVPVFVYSKSCKCTVDVNGIGGFEKTLRVPIEKKFSANQVLETGGFGLFGGIIKSKVRNNLPKPNEPKCYVPDESACSGLSVNTKKLGYSIQGSCEVVDGKDAEIESNGKCKNSQSVQQEIEKLPGDTPDKIKDSEKYQRLKEKSNTSSKNTSLVVPMPSSFYDLNKLSTNSIPALIGRTIKIIMQVIGTAALLMFIYGGLLIMTSRGESEKYNQGMKVMFWSAIGTITVLASYALVSFVFSAF